MRNDERLRTIYEVMAPYIIRNEHNWRDYVHLEDAGFEAAIPILESVGVV